MLSVVCYFIFYVEKHRCSFVNTFLVIIRVFTYYLTTDDRTNVYHKQ